MISQKKFVESVFRINSQGADNYDSITLNNIEALIRQTAAEQALPIMTNYDRLKSGNIFDSEVEDVLVVYHPKYKSNYYIYCIRIQSQGKIRIVLIDKFGESKNIQKNKNLKKINDELNWYSAMESVFESTLID